MSDQTPFSAIVRERCQTAHDGSEHSGFMEDLMRGRGTRGDYIALVAQHWFVYEALEQAVAGCDDPIAAPFLSDRLHRVPALEADLAFLIGPDWRDRIAPLPVTTRYTDRIREVGTTWAGGLIAHHYTRYLGDLSGGLYIGRAVQRSLDLQADGVRFYAFDRIPDPTAFKNDYRALLDTAAWSDAEKAHIVDEVLLAYRFNTELFTALTAARTAPPALQDALA